MGNNTSKKKSSCKKKGKHYKWHKCTTGEKLNPLLAGKCFPGREGFCRDTTKSGKCKITNPMGCFNDILDAGKKIITVGGKTIEITGEILEEFVEEIPELLEEGEDILKEGLIVIKELPELLDILVKLFEKLLHGLEWALDDKNKTVVLTAISILFIVWMMKDNSLIEGLLRN